MQRQREVGVKGILFVNMAGVDSIVGMVRQYEDHFDKKIYCSLRPKKDEFFGLNLNVSRH